MDEKVCPECGFKLPDGCDVCPECGCPLNSVKDVVTDGSNNSTISQAEIINDGCIATWRKHCQHDAAPIKALNTMSTVTEWCAIILTAFSVIYLIVQGIRLNSDIEIYYLYKKQALPLVLTIIILFSCEKICETVADCVEVYCVTRWLSPYRLDTSNCLELKNYGKTKKSSVFFSVHNIEVAYCGSHLEYVGTSIARTVGKCVLYVVSTVLFGLFVMPVIEQYILHVDNEYIFYGYFVGACAVEFLHWLIRRIIDKNLYVKVDTWRMKIK